MQEQVRIACQPGPQLRAAQSPANVLVYGGGAGGGKSFFQSWRACKFHNVRGYDACLFRRTSTMLTGSGSLFDECRRFYPDLGAEFTTRPLEFTWPHPSRVEFRHLQHEADVEGHKSKQYAMIGFDEATDFTGRQFTFMLSRLRTTCGVPTQFVLTCNPDPDSYLRTWVDWYIAPDGFPYPDRSGKLRYFIRLKDEIVWGDSRSELARYVDDPREVMSLTFIAALVQDNKVLMEADPTYLAKLKALPWVEQQRFLMGNWNAKESAGDYFQQLWFRQWGATALERALQGQDGPHSEIVYSVRWWDFAGTPVKGDLVPGVDRPSDFKAAEPGQKDPDWSAGVRLDVTKDGRVIVGDVRFYRDSPGAIEAAVVRHAMEDGPRCRVGLWQDPGQAAIGQMERLKARLQPHAQVVVTVASKNKQEYAREPSRAAYRGQLYYRGGAWNARFFNQLQQFPTKGEHDDAVDSLSGAWNHIHEMGLTGIYAYESADRPRRLIEPGTGLLDMRPRSTAQTAKRLQLDLQRRGVRTTNRFGYRVL